MTRFGWLSGVLLGLGLVGGVAAPGSGESPASTSLVQLRAVTVEARDDGLAVEIKTTRAPTYQTALIDTPTRLVIDFESTRYGWRGSPLSVDREPLRKIRGGQFKKDVARVVLELTREVGYRIEEGPEGITVKLESSPTPVAGTDTNGKPTRVAKAALAAGQTGPARASAPPAKRVAQAVKTPQATSTKPRVPRASAPKQGAWVRLAQASQTQAPPSNGSRLISLDFKDADINNILRILAAESGKNIVAGEDVKGKVTISLHNVSWELALDTILEAKGLVKLERENVLRIVSNEQLTKERELKAKAEQAKVKAEAEARTKMAEAELKEAQAKQRKLEADAALAEAQARGPLKEETIRLNYADPEEVAATLQGILGIPAGGAAVAATPIMTQPGVTPSIGLGGPPPIAEPPFSALYGPPGAPAGPAVVSPTAEVLAKGITIRAHKATNTLFIRHYERDLERIKKLIRESLDVPLPQVKIEARMEILDRPSLFEIGIQWGGSGVGRQAQNVMIGQGNSPRVQTSGGVVGIPTDPSPPFPLNAVNDALTLAEFLPVDPITGLATGGNIVNLPFTGGSQTRLPAGGISFGIVGTRFNLNLALQALERLEKAKSLARPEIVTVENKPAQVSLGEEIPYATISSAGTQIQFKEAVLKLEVTPTVIREEGGITRIKMKVIVENNERGIVLAGVPAIRKRRAETEVIVKEGEVLVIGGVTQRTSQEVVSKVPFFGDIPILGWLFKRKLTEVDPDREMVVFITPTVVRSGVPYPGVRKPASKGS